ncbi:hypothetical protein DPMN_027427 [Dreissena polymorpha]|uniref:Uncharacterized protein n=1 Tax=Dreissena polymorpha TaxID=45954 RepID=A0A9D4LV61_DREPO|nr:hypothetical protein DPMN_027427 [Dreissena polymorpha]
MRHFPCTLTSRRLPGPFRTNKMHADQPAPFGRTRCTLTSRCLPRTLTSRRLPCTLTSRRLPCTLTSPFISYASFPRPLSDEQCTLTSRCLPSGRQPFLGITLVFPKAPLKSAYPFEM